MNSESWWDQYHRQHWEANGGRLQTRLFMEALLAHLPAEIVRYLERSRASIVDWGCALGDGVAVLGRALPACTVGGIDCSPTAIESARAAFPGHRFERHEGEGLPRSFDVVVTSNCLEHFKNPLAVVRAQLESCRKLYVAMVPYDESPLIDQHVSQFRDESFPERLGSFERVFSTRFDVDERAWPDQQLLVVYASDEARAELFEVPSERSSADEAQALLAALEQGIKLRSEGTAVDRDLDRALLELRRLVGERLGDAARAAELQNQRARTASLEQQLALIERSVAWCATRALCRAIDLVAPPGTLLHGAAAGTVAALRWLLAWPFRLVCRCLSATGLGGRQSWYAFAFARYREARDEVHARDLAGVHGPEVPGLVSIVLPVYNGADYVAESIESVLAQSWREFELIVVDDGSTDATPAIVAELAQRDGRIRTITQRNERLPRALSNGFRAARGEFLTWTSADNRLKPDFLEKLVACLRRHPDQDMVWANQDIIDEDGEPLRGSSWFAGYQQPPGSEHVHLPADPSELNVWPNNYVGAAFLYRSRVRQLLGDYSPWRFGLEDYDYWMRVNGLLRLRHADFDEPVYDYRFHAASLTARDEELGITRDRQRLMVFEEFRRDFCLVPITWILGEGDGALRDELIARIRAAGHQLVERAEVDARTWPIAWIPSVHVAFDGRPPENGLPDSTLVVALGSSASEAGLDAADLRVVVGGELPAELDEPTSWLGAPDVGRAFTAIDVRCRSEHLARLEGLIESERIEPLDATVVICTYQRSDQLVRALRSVAEQDFPVDRFEVVVVDNGPQHAEIAAVVEDLRARHFGDGPALRTYHCPLLGLSFARNVGLAAARGRCLLFLDDDAIAPRNWVSTLVASFERHPEAGVIGGRILLAEPDPRPEWFQDAWRAYWSHFDPPHRSFATAAGWWQFPWGANWAARRKALLQAGGFRTRYGRIGQDFGGGEEIVAGELVRKLGWTVGVEPASQVVHDVDRRRFTLEHVRKTIRSAAHVNYQTQRDLHTPMDPRIVAAFARAARAALGTLLSPRSERLERWRARVQLGAAWSLLCRQLGDRWRLARGSRWWRG